MTSMLGKAGKRALERHVSKYAPQDPMYEVYTDHRGKQRRRRRDLPPGLSERDMKILRSVQKRAHYLDKGFSVCGMHFGWTFIIGIIPGAGDVADAVLNYVLVVRKCRQADLPAWLVRRMLMNNAVSAIAGFIPVVGDILLAAFKANSRNAVLLEEFLQIRGEEYLKLKAEKREGGTSTQGPSKDTTAGQDKEMEGYKEHLSAEQVKPGAGVKPGEVIPVPKSSAAGGSAKQNFLGSLRKRSGTGKGKASE